VARIQTREQLLDPGSLLFALLQVLTHPVSHLRIVLEPSNLSLEQLDRLILDCMLVAQARHINLSAVSIVVLLIISFLPLVA
jgi:hypothetical protein